MPIDLVIDDRDGGSCEQTEGSKRYGAESNNGASTPDLVSFANISKLILNS